MKKVIAYPCTRCEKLTNAKILIYQYVSENMTVVRFKTECCHTEFVKFFNAHDLKWYVKEVQNES